MNNFFTSLGGNQRVQSVLLGWVMPGLVAAFAFVVLLLPEIRTSAVVVEVRAAATALGINKTLLVVGLTIALAATMSLTRVLLYRILEGLAWPGLLARDRIEHVQRPHMEYLCAERDYVRLAGQRNEAETTARTEREAAERDGNASGEYLKQLEAWLEDRRTAERDAAVKLGHARTRRLHRGYEEPLPLRIRLVPRRGRPWLTPMQWRGREVEAPLPYPVDSEQVMATRIGNALRSIETFGVNTYGLDSQTLWYELYSEAPSSLQSAVDDAEIQTDMLVCALYSVVGLVVAAFAGATWRTLTDLGGIRLWITGVVLLLMLPLLHRMLLAAIGEWGETIQALVQTGRLPLRKKLGLREPLNADEERTMWQALVGFVYYGDESYRDTLDRFRNVNALSDIATAATRAGQQPADSHSSRSEPSK